MNKKMKLNIYGLGMGWLLLCSGHTMANDVYEAMRGCHWSQKILIKF
ncbi:hypothetical protein ACK2M2_12000 [Acinetobacter sp. TY1]